MGGEVKNLKYLYHQSEVMWLLGLRFRMQIVRLRKKQNWHTFRISSSQFYYRSEIDAYCDSHIASLPESEQFMASINLERHRLAIPRHDLDISVWIPVQEAIKTFTFAESHSDTNRYRVLQLMRDNLVRVQRIYYTNFIYKPDLERMLTILT